MSRPLKNRFKNVLEDKLYELTVKILEGTPMDRLATFERNLLTRHMPEICEIIEGDEVWEEF